MIKRNGVVAAACTAGAGALFFGVSAMAQEIDEVLVTATKRSESELKVPLSIEAITGEKLAEDGLRNLDDISARVPNVTFANGLTQATIAIRGMGSGPDRSFEQSVAMFIDGIYMPRSRQYRAPLLDVDRLEILRGPQALLFGLNATAGSVNITTSTTRPGDESVLNVSAGYEAEFSGFNTSVVAGSSLGEKVGGRLAVQYTDTGDGHYYNEFTGQRENTAQELVARGTLVFEPSDALTLTGKIFYADADEAGNFGETYGLTSATLGDGRLDFVRNSDERYLQVISDRGMGLDHQIFNVSAQLEYGFNDYMLSGTVAYSKSDYDYLVEIGNLPEGFASQGAALYERFDQTSFEVHLTSPADRTLSYLVGVYAAKNDTLNIQPNVFGDLFRAAFPVGVTALRGDSVQSGDTETWSGFAALTWNVSDTFRLIGGARYSHEEKSNHRETTVCRGYSGSGDTGYVPVADLPLVPPYIGFCGTLPGYRDSKGSSNFMPELTAQWDFTAGSNVYAKIGKSAKSGGYAFSRSVTADSISYDDEIAKTAELGIKSKFLDGRATFTAALFHTKFEDLQLTSFEWTGTAILAAIRNAGESVSKGLEADFKFAASNWLTVGVSAAYLESEYESFVNGPCYIAEPGRDPISGSCDKSGERTPNAPKYSGAVFAELDVPVGSQLAVTGGFNVAFSDWMYTESTLNPNAIQDSYHRIDARIGLAAADRRWDISLIGKNLGNEAINNLTQPIATVTFEGYLAPPRTVTLQGTYRF